MVVKVPVAGTELFCYCMHFRMAGSARVITLNGGHLTHSDDPHVAIFRRKTWSFISIQCNMCTRRAMADLAIYSRLLPCRIISVFFRVIIGAQLTYVAGVARRVERHHRITPGKGFVRNIAKMTNHGTHGIKPLFGPDIVGYGKHL